MNQRLSAAKAEAAAAGGRFKRSFSAAIGSRAISAVALMFVIAFGMTLIVSPPPRFPPVGGLSFVQVGLPIGALESQADLEKASGVAGDAAEASERQGFREIREKFFADNPIAYPILNGLGLLAALALLYISLRLQARQHKRGLEPF